MKDWDPSSDRPAADRLAERLERKLAEEERMAEEARLRASMLTPPRPFILALPAADRGTHFLSPSRIGRAYAEDGRPLRIEVVMPIGEPSSILTTATPEQLAAALRVEIVDVCNLPDDWEERGRAGTPYPFLG